MTYEANEWQATRDALIDLLIYLHGLGYSGGSEAGDMADYILDKFEVTAKPETLKEWCNYAEWAYRSGGA